MVTDAHLYPTIIKNLTNIMRMDVIDQERYGSAALIGIVRSDNTKARNAG